MTISEFFEEMREHWWDKENSSKLEFMEWFTEAYERAEATMSPEEFKALMGCLDRMAAAVKELTATRH
jgi:hypothetical protein